uniref:Uncharacterized protein n=1 Tax=Triticum urartu TaxID=4572 RepID=A0A8R7RH47_TRIUA
MALPTQSTHKDNATRSHYGFRHEAVGHPRPPPLRARGVRGDRGRQGQGAVRRGVLPGRAHHLRQLPRPGARRVRLRVRAGRRQGLRAPPRRRRDPHQLRHDQKVLAELLV